ncbi:AMP binding protein [Crepidotus variabilis]|uniref:AMP binding protein n=1 Tax=Crepidotus variabilis TaxID=179855 RepID=A0A9P6ECM4_9AGAR|nr:AMP binding protein [Crepidotus variabilis]
MRTCTVFTHLFNTNNDPKKVGEFSVDHLAFIDGPTGTSLTRGQVKKLALAFGYGITHHPLFRAKRGETVLIYSQNSLVWPIVLFGSVAAGLQCTLANNAYTPPELAHQYADSGARIIMTSEDGVANVREMLKTLGLGADEADKRIIIMAKGLDWAGGPIVKVKPEAASLIKVSDLLKLGVLSVEERFDEQTANETVYLCYSSGTTGKPKGVESMHRNITAVVDAVKASLSEMNENDNMLGILPFYHIYGAIKLLHFPFATGTPVYIMPRFDPVDFCAYIEKYKITAALVVPPVLVVLARHPIVDKYDLSTLNLLFSGAAPLGATLAKQVASRLLENRKGKGYLNILQGYGLTETSPTSHLVPVPDGTRKIGSAGLLLPNLEARLVVDGEGDGLIDAKEGEPGELWMRGPTIMKGYLNRPDATKDSITPDKWFKTGDIAIRDKDGFYWIVDRRKELIKYKGFQVPPAELESVLLTHPDVADAAVIGVESAQEATELPRAYIVPAKPDAVKTEIEKAKLAASVQRWIQSKVAKHKYLRGGVVVIDVVPKSAAGKILRRELRERAKQELGNRDPAEKAKAKL